MRWNREVLGRVLALAHERGEVSITLDDRAAAESFRFAIYRHRLWDAAKLTATLDDTVVTILRPQTSIVGVEYPPHAEN